MIVLRLDDYDDLSCTLGHQVTDAIVQKVYQCIDDHLDNEDLVCLLTSSSFVIGLRNMDKEQAYERAKELTKPFQDGVKVEGFTIDINIHAGIACFPEHGHTTNLLTRRVALARFLALRTHTRIFVYQPNRIWIHTTKYGCPS